MKIITRIKHFFRNLLFGIFASIFTSLLILVAINLFLEKIYLRNNLPQHDWTVLFTTYDPRYVFWQNCLDEFCPEKFGQNYPLDKIGIYTNKFNSEKNKEANSCLKILFLGDSFSSSPFSDHSYSYYFADSLAKNSSFCVETISIASGGAGNSQELARLEDVIEQAKPNAVIWQFYWNDFFDNIRFSLFEINNEELIRKKAWDSSAFWSGYINQKIHLLEDSTLGKFISTKMFYNDLFHSQPADDRDFAKVIEYNQKFIPLAIKRVEKLGEKNNFKLFTTLSPMECQFNTNSTCEKWAINFQDQLRKILSENNNYLSMEKEFIINDQEKTIEESQNKEILFAENDKLTTKGIRHLSDDGEKYFGGILLQNFLNKIS
ncbi:MAG: hypothetical protein COU63_04985 [Candidatus Pacebacteria bacterium CG10_big_fil_rev_8_21_14_0_10_36_11]|nr:hypothetical protein [Candidatus Pacearchaeota archaeon]OIP73826.1 MAG: hypothetical protein AUK08_04695 [Candidatus Pacebacteria bacterium CG2_30_36_39]PIR64292.1 MAG: hypothetical protein COU63_04985 [Candidatus Pacebacteria bacterium CG10_big_fil_rev_8_21_14_0_10_36_11]PJC42927.1 MAG: hypothetical protein CO040_01895 [Candidatus Pacebacteria bacterium CG_4_9_14_0_2_um_filter_36_8]